MEAGQLHCGNWGSEPGTADPPFWQPSPAPHRGRHGSKATGRRGQAVVMVAWFQAIAGKSTRHAVAAEHCAARGRTQACAGSTRPPAGRSSRTSTTTPPRCPTLCHDASTVGQRPAAQQDAHRRSRGLPPPGLAATAATQPCTCRGHATSHVTAPPRLGSCRGGPTRLRPQPRALWTGVSTGRMDWAARGLRGNGEVAPRRQ